MQFLHSPPLHPFTTPKTLPKPSFLPKPIKPSQNFPLFSSYVPEAPLLNEEFVAKFRPKGDETESEARHRNWKIHGWAPWEEILTPEADFAKKSLDEGEEVPLRTPEAIEAFKMLRPSYREKKRKEMGLTEDEYLEKQFEIKGEILEKYETSWAGPLVVRLVAPRDWPPRGWVVDREELEFIREGHKMMNERVDVESIERVASREEDEIGVERYKVFLKQYEEWVLHNKDRLEKESYEIDQDYHPGRRKRGKDYKEGMYELPFYYPGQICVGKVTTIHLYQGAFVDIGGVYEGWVPIKNNDWFWIRQYIKVNMQVIVEIVAKRDPYRFRFPIELCLLDPNIDHLIFNRFEFPPIFHRDTTPDELRRDSGRPPVTRKETSTRPEEDPLVSDHPYVDKLWQINAAEQMILNDMEANPHKYEGKKLSELTDDEEFDEENSVVYSKVRYKDSILPKVTLKTSVRDLDLESAFAERQHNKRLQKEAEERGEEFKVAKLRRHLEMDEYDLIHWRRSFEEREALIRDVSCRQALGLPLEEPGRYANARELLKGQYDPGSSLYRHDYWGEPKNSEKSKLMKLSDIHNKSIVGRGTLWYDMAYEDVIKQMEERKKAPREDSDEEDEVEDELDFDNSVFHKFIPGDYDGEAPLTFFGNEDDPQVKWDD